MDSWGVANHRLLIISVIEFKMQSKVQDAPVKESHPTADLKMENSPSIQDSADKTFQ